MLKHHPPLPPAHPAFQKLMASIPVMVAMEGANMTAHRLREKVDAIRRDARDPERLCRSGLSIYDVMELDAWLEHRIRELECGR